MGERGKALFSKMKKEHWIACALAGLLLLVISIPAGNGGDEEEEVQEEDAGEEEGTALDTAAVYGEQLAALLAQTEGVGKVSVAVSLEDTGVITVEKDRREQSEEASDTQEKTSSSQSSTEEDTVYEEKGSGGSSPYVVSRSSPSIRGVLVVCEGGGDPAVVQEIKEAAEAFFHVEAHKIKVLKMAAAG